MGDRIVVRVQAEDFADRNLIRHADLREIGADDLHRLHDTLRASQHARHDAEITLAGTVGENGLRWQLDRKRAAGNLTKVVLEEGKRLGRIGGQDGMGRLFLNIFARLRMHTKHARCQWVNRRSGHWLVLRKLSINPASHLP